MEKDDICCESEFELFQNTFTQQSEPVTKRMLRMLRDSIRPSKTLIKELAVQINAHERLKVKRVYHQNQVPHRYSCSDF